MENTKVFSPDLKLQRVSEDLQFSGSLFHMWGALKKVGVSDSTISEIYNQKKPSWI